MTASKKQWKVTAACVVVNLEGQDRYLYKGAIVPEGVGKADIVRLSNTGLIVEAPVEAPVDTVKIPVEPTAEEKAAAEAAKAATNTFEGATAAETVKADSGRAAASKPAK